MTGESCEKQSDWSVMSLADAVSVLPGFNATMISAAAHSPRPDPAFMFGPYTEAQLTYFRAATYNPSVTLYSLREVDVVGPWFSIGSLLVREDVSFSCQELDLDAGSREAHERLNRHRSDLGCGRRFRKSVAEQAVLLATNGHQIYGHWLVDFLPKIYLLRHVGYDISKLKFLMPENMGNFGVSLLDVLGIKPDRLISYDPDKEAVRVEELLVPTVLRWGGRLSSVFMAAIEYINERIDAENKFSGIVGNSRIFLSRAKIYKANRPVINSERLESVATDAGFSVIHPEQLSIPEQIFIFRNATHVIGQYGSALHGTIFSRPGITVGGLHGPPPAAFDGVQSGIAERLGQSAGYVFGSLPPDAPDDSAMVVDEYDLAACIRTRFA